MSEEKKIFCFNAKLNSDRYFNPKSDAFKKTYILIDNEKILLKDLWEEHKQLKRLEQENERLKQSEQEGLEINAELEHYLACMTEQRNKLKLALEEISGICKSVEFPLMSKIINIIDEVLE